jgi:outer membrane protein TolC
MSGVFVCLSLFMSLPCFAQLPEPVPEPLLLRECLALADANNPEIQAARSAAAAKQAGVQTSVASFLPTLDAESSLSRSDTINRSHGTRTNTILDIPASLSVSQLLFDFGKAHQGYRQSKHDAAAAEYSVDVTRGQVFLAVKTAYIGLLKAQRALGIAQETLQQRERLINVTQELFDSGIRPRFDVVRAQIDAQNARLDLIEAETRLAREGPNLEAALGVSGLEPRALEDILKDQGWALDESRVQRTALERRPEVSRQREQIESQRNSLGLVRRAFWPTTSASSALVYRQSNAGGAFLGHSREWTVGVSAKLNLFGGFSSVAAVTREKIFLQKTLEELKVIEQKISAEALQAYQTVAGEARKLKITRDLEILARENENLSWQLYRSGKGTIILVTDAQSQLLSARVSRLNSLADHSLALSRLEYSVGAGLGDIQKR